MAAKKYDAGVKEYRTMYWQPDYQVKDSDSLAVFKGGPQPGVPRE
jgi:ribulose-bisphosphate carboxylase large chain